MEPGGLFSKILDQHKEKKIYYLFHSPNKCLLEVWVYKHEYTPSPEELTDQQENDIYITNSSVQ